MADDAIIQEVRAVRHQIAAECGNDVDKIIARAHEDSVRLGLNTKAA